MHHVPKVKPHTNNTGIEQRYHACEANALPLRHRGGTYLEFIITDFQLSNGLFFFERCSFITATVCAYKLNNARK